MIDRSHPVISILLLEKSVGEVFELTSDAVTSIKGKFIEIVSPCNYCDKTQVKNWSRKDLYHGIFYEDMVWTTAISGITITSFFSHQRSTLPQRPQASAPHISPKPKRKLNLFSTGPILYKEKSWTPMRTMVQSWKSPLCFHPKKWRIGTSNTLVVLNASMSSTRTSLSVWTLMNISEACVISLISIVV